MTSIFELNQFITNPPYRSKNKIKHILKNDYDQTISDADLFFTGPQRLNNININEAKKEYAHRVVSTPGGYIGDLMFPLDDYQQTIFLVLIEINTRKAYALKVQNKDTRTLMKAFQTLLQQLTKPMRTFRFDEERAIRSNEFQNMLARFRIEFQPIHSQQHTSSSVIDRLICTIRNIAFNMNINIDSQEKMDLILNYYNNAPHKTLSTVILQSEPELRSLFKYGITPNEVASIPELEIIFAKECIKHNLDVTKNKENIIGQLCRLYNKKEGADLFKKKRSKLSTEVFYVISKQGHLFRCVNVDDMDDVRYAPRFEIKLLSE